MTPTPPSIRRWAAGLLLLVALPAAAQNDCLTPHPSPGCSSPICSAAVCATLPACCAVAWDSACATEALFACEGCGSTPEGCLLPHTKPGCSDADCCETVCLSDDYCCSVEWDDTCALLAQVNCTVAPPVACGDPGAGSCLSSHPTPSCSDAACCDQVCAALSSCCTTAWDSLCVGLASSICVTTCDPGCPAGSVQESEPCGDRTNDPVFRPGSATGVPQAIARNTDVCGRLTVAQSLQDVDVYRVNLQGLDTDGDGKVKIRVLLTSASPVFAAVVPAGSAASVLPGGARLTVNGTGCGTRKGWACVEPASWWVVVARGQDGVISSTGTDCNEGRYRLRVETDAVCGNPCGAGSGDCFVPHATPGCVQPSCCSATCAVLPDCCDITWDAACTVAADEACGAPVPANDTCAMATRVGTGNWAMTTLGATKDGQAVPVECRVASSDSTRDVWFRWKPARSGECQIDLCGSPWDTRLEVFTGTCGSTTRVACGDDSPFCSPSRGSRLTLQATCGTDYLIRVSGVADERGFGTLNIAVPSGPVCCPGDLDASSAVDAGDIGYLLTVFGPCPGGTPGCVGDLDFSGAADAGDIGFMLTQFGPCP